MPSVRRLPSGPASAWSRSPSSARPATRPASRCPACERRPEAEAASLRPRLEQRRPDRGPRPRAGRPDRYRVARRRRLPGAGRPAAYAVRVGRVQRDRGHPRGARPDSQRNRQPADVPGSSGVAAGRRRGGTVGSRRPFWRSGGRGRPDPPGGPRRDGRRGPGGDRAAGRRRAAPGAAADRRPGSSRASPGRSPDATAVRGCRRARLLGSLRGADEADRRTGLEGLREATADQRHGRDRRHRQRARPSLAGGARAGGDGAGDRPGRPPRGGALPAARRRDLDPRRGGGGRAPALGLTLAPAAYLPRERTMPASVPGIHHVTCITGDVQRNVDFYVGVLGLRFIKKTVNFDVPDTYHIYFADYLGTPGTAMTFFGWPHLPWGAQGAGQVAAVSFAVPRDSLDFWAARLHDFGVEVAETHRFDIDALTFRDPDQMRLELVGEASDDRWTPWEDGPVAPENAIRGFHCVRLLVQEEGPTAHFLTETFGFREVGRETGRVRFETG